MRQHASRVRKEKPVSYKVRIADRADDDLRRLYAFLYERDPLAADNARAAVAKGLRLLEEFSLTCRKAFSANPFVRERVISFGRAGYVALFEITDDAAVTALAARHQREGWGLFVVDVATQDLVS